MALARPFPRVLRVAHIVALVWAVLLGAGRFLRPDPIDCCGPLGTARQQRETTAELRIPGNMNSVVTINFLPKARTTG